MVYITFLYYRHSEGRKQPEQQDIRQLFSELFEVFFRPTSYSCLPTPFHFLPRCTSCAVDTTITRPYRGHCPDGSRLSLQYLKPAVCWPLYQLTIHMRRAWLCRNKTTHTAWQDWVKWMVSWTQTEGQSNNLSTSLALIMAACIAIIWPVFCHSQTHFT